MPVVGVGVPTDACRRRDGGDHPMVRSSSVGNRVQRMSPAERLSLQGAVAGCGLAEIVKQPRWEYLTGIG